MSKLALATKRQGPLTTSPVTKGYSTLVQSREFWNLVNLSLLLYPDIANY